MGKTILLANDDVAYADQLAGWLQARGFSVIIQNCYQRDISNLTALQADIVLCDFDRTKGGRMDVIKELQNNLTKKDVPVVILTKYPDRSLNDRISKNKAISYLTKADCTQTKIVDFVQQLFEPGQLSQFAL